MKLALKSDIELNNLLVSFAINPSLINSKEKDMISYLISNRNSWLLKYHYREDIGVEDEEIENYENIRFCKEFLFMLILVGQKRNDSRCLKFISSLPMMDNNSECEDEILHRDIFDFLLTYERNKFRPLVLDKCKSTPGSKLSFYRRSLEIYKESGADLYRYEVPSLEVIDEIVDTLSKCFG